MKHKNKKMEEFNIQIQNNNNEMVKTGPNGHLDVGVACIHKGFPICPVLESRFNAICTLCAAENVGENFHMI